MSESIGQRIKQRRIEMGLSVIDVAKKMGKDRTTIYKYEDGTVEDIPLSVIEPLAKVLDTTPIELVGWCKEGEVTKPMSKNPFPTETDFERIYEEYLNSDLPSAPESLQKARKTMSEAFDTYLAEYSMRNTIFARLIYTATKQGMKKRCRR